MAIVVGELSGDLLAAGLVTALRKLVPELVVYGIVGPNLREVGAIEWYKMQHLSVMGLLEPLLMLPKLWYIRERVYQKLIADPPDLFIGVDAPEFNLGLERKLKKHNIATVHYVSPSVWAWRPGRIKLIKQAVDLVLTLFPFEVDFYQHHKVNAYCVGHQLADQIPLLLDPLPAKQALGFTAKDLILTIMPGSRDSELRHLAKIYLEAAKELFWRFPQLKFIIPVVSLEHKIYIEKLINTLELKRFNIIIKVILKNSQGALQAADLVLVTSGTATLEAMLYKKPMVVAYKTNFVTYWIIKQLILIKNISLPNLLAGRKIVPELIQTQVTVINLVKNLTELLAQRTAAQGTEDLCTKQLELFSKIHTELKKDANTRAAEAIAGLLACKS